MNDRMRSLGSLAFCLLVASSEGVGSAIDQEPPNDSDSEAMVEALQQGYLANREAFDAFTCTFVVKEGGANTVEEALAGDLFNVILSNGLWVVDGDRQRYELICEDRQQELPRLPEQQPGDGRRIMAAGVDCMSTTILTDGVLGLSYSPVLAAANIGTGFGSAPQILHTPLSMGMMGSNESQGPGLQQRHGFDVVRQYGGQRMAGDVPCEVLLISLSRGSVREWSLDPGRGFVPIELRYFLLRGDEEPRERDLASWTIVTDVRKCANGAYFPERSVTIVQPEAIRAKRARIIELRELDLSRPDPSAFAIEVPPRTRIVEPPTMLANVRVPAAERIHVDDLEQWVERCRDARDAKLAERAPHERTPPERPSREPARLLLVAGSLTIIVLCVVWDAFRRRRRGWPVAS